MLSMRTSGAKTSSARLLCAKRSAPLTATLLGLLAVPTLFAQATVELEVQTDRPYVNETLRVELRVSNFQECEQPKVPDLPNCTFAYVGSSSGMSAYTDPRGRFVSVKQRTFIYELTPHKPGTLTILTIPVVVDGKTLKTEPRQLTVRELPQSASPGGGQRDVADGASELLLAEISCAQSKLYVGQRADFTLTIWIKRAEFNRDALDLSEMLQFLTGSFGPFNTRDVTPRAAQRRTVDGSTHVYYVIELPAEFTVDQPGPLNFETVSVAMDYPLRYARSFFNDVRVLRPERVRIRPTVAAPDVQPLPSDGRPANFSGAVGQYALSAFAVPTNVRIGDPIQLIVDISGDPVETIPGPDLTSIQKLTENFRVPAETLAGTVSGNRKRFTQTIRAKRADVKEIPPIEFAYFDPKAEKYVIARSEPLPILVSAVEQLDADDLTAITAQPTKHAETVEARDGLRGNKTHEGELLASTHPVTLTQVALTTLIPPLLFTCIWGGAALTRSGRDRAVRRRRKALRNAERRIQGAVARKLPPREFHSEIEAALAGYLADRLNEPPARFLGHAAVSFLRERGVDQELVERYGEILERCERATYAGASDGDTSLADLARHCAQQLERERL
jgi:hypothetical protein